MSNTELNLHQLENFAGGGVFAKLDGIKPNHRRVIHPDYQPLEISGTTCLRSENRF